MLNEHHNNTTKQLQRKELISAIVANFFKPRYKPRKILST